MPRYLLIFNRKRSVRFLSHLEEVRALERTLRRSKIPLSYSQGFSPRPIMSFGPPIPVGFSSRVQLMEIKLDKQLTPEEIFFMINPTLPYGYNLSEVKFLNENYPSLGSFPLEISYLLLIEGNGLKLSINSFLSQPYYQVLREGNRKKKEKLFNIRPFVLHLEVINRAEVNDFLKTINISKDPYEITWLMHNQGTVIFFQSLYTTEGSVKITELEKALNVKIIDGERINLTRHR
ncbi:MAG: hypothetical protein DDT40_00647 [candidate division WS2 bacterium]|uniref:DUF2344 domain-containing protein n=1 Tax=Psychracetigena formicireducens TaxID=2986056 RepID=A0A9E2BGX1_PSYF1|nr:hypothetical protein [Candidatus Psychracetigena formicireducens]MBT9145366.1 hypothetical protein [Candidatus Psychracetigena formicireducens]MBT9150475.1 hypothetical protein [Candidatus Psychracetigena formicireducens]